MDLCSLRVEPTGGSGWTRVCGNEDGKSWGSEGFSDILVIPGALGAKHRGWFVDGCSLKMNSRGTSGMG